MEYFVGAGITLMSIFVFNKFVDKKIPKQKKLNLKFSQSRMFILMEPFKIFMDTFIEKEKPQIKTQATNFVKKNTIKILFSKDKAYWIKDNKVFVANTIDGKIDQESASVVDTMNMNKIELDNMIHIVEELTRGIKDDTSDSGK